VVDGLVVGVSSFVPTVAAGGGGGADGGNDDSWASGVRACSVAGGAIQAMSEQKYKYKEDIKNVVFC
jgi:hypothetical protein